MKRKFLKIITALFLSLGTVGCATSDYELYATTQLKMAEARAAGDRAKYQALAHIAESGDSAAKVAAVITMAMQSNGGTAMQSPTLNAPRSAGDTALAWLSVLLPNVTQMYGINRQTRLGETQAITNAEIQVANTRAFVDIAGKIQAPAANVSSVVNTTNTTVRDSGNVTRDSGNTTTNNTSVTRIVRDSGNTTTNTTRDSNNTTSTTNTTTTTTNTNNSKTNSENSSTSTTNTNTTTTSTNEPVVN